MDKSSDIKLSTIINRLDRLITAILELVKIMDPDHDLDLFKDQIRDQDHDHDHDLSDQDLIDWFSDFLSENGIEPQGRDFTTVLRNIRYFWSRYKSISNPVKYCASFLPPIKKQTTPDPEADPNLCFGFDRDFLLDKMKLLSPAILSDLYKLHPDLKSTSTLKLPKSMQLARTLQLTSLALKDKLIE